MTSRRYRHHRTPDPAPTMMSPWSQPPMLLERRLAERQHPNCHPTRVVKETALDGHHHGVRVVMDRGEIDDAEAILEPGGSFEAVLLAPAAVFLLPSRLFATRRQRRRLTGRRSARGGGQDSARSATKARSAVVSGRHGRPAVRRAGREVRLVGAWGRRGGDQWRSSGPLR